MKGMSLFKDNYGLGDVSNRENTVDTDLSTVTFANKHYDQTNTRKGPNVIDKNESVLKKLTAVGMALTVALGAVGTVTVTNSFYDKSINK
jgi:hypothetical protein